MAIRLNLPTPTPTPHRNPPTQGQLSKAIIALANALPPSMVPLKLRDQFAEQVYQEVEEGPLCGVDTAWGAITAAEAAVFLAEYCRNGQVPARVRGQEAVNGLLDVMSKARAEDIPRIKEIRTNLRASPAPAPKEAARLRVELKELALDGLPQTASFPLVHQTAVAVLRDAVTSWFGAPPKSSAEKALRREVGKNLAFFLILLTLLGSHQQKEEFFKAARAQSEAEPAPEADVEELSDEDGAETEVEEEAPAAEEDQEVA